MSGYLTFFVITVVKLRIIIKWFFKRKDVNLRWIVF